MFAGVNTLVVGVGRCGTWVEGLYVDLCVAAIFVGWSVYCPVLCVGVGSRVVMVVHVDDWSIVCVSRGEQMVS